MNPTDVIQPSLFVQTEEQAPQSNQRPEPTRQQLLDALETLFRATEACCDLPETVSDVYMGMRTQRLRAERLCPGYANRYTASERELTTMIYHIYIVVLTSSMEIFCLHARPDRALVRECVDIAASWLHFHPQSEEATR